MSSRAVLRVGLSWVVLVVGACTGSGGDDAGADTCGNGDLETDEACEGLELRGATCGNFGFTSGTVTCAADCTVDTSGCSTCGDGVRSGAEACDGEDFGDASCATLDQGGGQLRCAAGCADVDTQLCRPACDDDLDCPVDTDCVEGACRNICQIRSECGAGEHCGAQGYCAPGCGIDFDCDDTEDCVDGTCTPFDPECSGDGVCECGDTEVCRRYRCEPAEPCSTAGDCACFPFELPACNGFTGVCFDASN